MLLVYCALFLVGGSFTKILIRLLWDLKTYSVTSYWGDFVSYEWVATLHEKKIDLNRGLRT
jgi:hypothetical protein